MQPDGKTPSALANLAKPKTVKVIILTTVMFTFISYWRAAGLVIGDLGSTAYYIGGIAEQFVGKSAPYFILGVMIFSYAVRAVYIESCGMFVRGGVYRVVKAALGGWFGKISVSALVFDYVLTGPISAVSAGIYLIGLINILMELIGIHTSLNVNLWAVLVGCIITVYFWWENVKGIEESSDKALKIFIITIVMAVIILSWAVITLLLKDEPFFKNLPPLKVNLSPEAYGWFANVDWIKSIGFFSILIAFGHSLLALSGEESMAQVYREVESPKLKNFKKAAFIIFVFSVILTPGVSFLATMLIPDNVRPQYIDNLISGVAMFVHGPLWARLILQSFVVVVGVLILSGAVNTSIVGANGVLNRVAEDKVLMDWFRKPHKKFGTSYRILSLIAVLQIATIILSRGNIITLGEAYAFGVIWSMTFNAFSMLILRFKDKRPREWKVPVNLRIGNTTLPIGLFLIFFVLLTVALTNLLTKPIATVSGIIFTAGFFGMFTVSEILNKKKIMREQHMTEEEFDLDHLNASLEHFNLDHEQDITPEAIGSENNDRVVVAVRDPNNLTHLQKIINETDTDKTDIIVFIGRVFKDKINMQVNENIEEDERKLFSQVVTIAEKIGKPVIPMVVPTNNAFFSIVSVANALKAREIVLGLSAKFKPDVQLQQLALLWGTVQSDENQHITIRIISADAMEFKQEL
jgi:amino acid transporter